MESISSDDLHVATPDDTVLVLRRTGSGAAVLVLPDVGELIDQHAQLARILKRTVYRLELRGHGLSEGRWSMHRHIADVHYIIGLLKRKYEHLMVIAYGASAKAMLVLEDRYGHEHSMPEAMILVWPGDAAVRVQTPTVAIGACTATGNVRRHSQKQGIELLALIKEAVEHAAERPLRFSAEF